MFYEFYSYIKNKYFEELKTLPAPTREAMIFKRTCEEIPIEIKRDDLIAGWYGCENDVEYKITENKEFAFMDAYSQDEINIKNEFYEKFGCIVRFDRAHTCIDYGHIVKYGLKSYEIRVKEELKKENITDSKKTMLEAMLISIDAVKLYAKRFSNLADQMHATDNSERLLKIRNVLLKIPYEPCENFYEAISAIWMMHTLIPVSENSWASISLGRIDQYLYPFYQKSLSQGETRENIKNYLKNLFLLLDSYGDGACALNIGGMDEEGHDQVNELSRLLIEVEKEMRLSSPIFVTRVNPNTPDDILDQVIDIKLFSIGQPTFYGEIPCRNALMDRGVPPKDAVDFSANSCMGLYISGEEIASMWGCVFNMHLPLELAINKGQPLFYPLPFDMESNPLEEVNDIDTLFEAYEKYLRELFVLLFGYNRKNAVNCANNTPNPLLSAITKGCIESGLDRAVGAKYNTETVETMALVNTANAICAIDTLVFKQKKYTLSQIITATQNNFEGYGEILTDIRKCDKYGINSRYADGFALRLCEITATLCKELSFDNIYFLPSLHTLDTNVSFGNRLYSTLDGRLAGEPVAKNAGPTNDVRTSDPTSLILSAAYLNQKLFSGGQPIDLYFDKSMLEAKESRDKIKALIKTYFELDGLQLQVNSIDIELLEKAYRKPEDYPQLIVRIGGYSRRFTELSKNAQKEFIERFKNEKGA